jgi:hypothetical protein
MPFQIISRMVLKGFEKKGMVANQASYCSNPGRSLLHPSVESFWTPGVSLHLVQPTFKRERFMPLRDK